MKSLFKTKSRAEIIESKADSLLHDILISNFSNAEVALIVNAIRSKAKHVLQERNTELNKEQIEAVNAINSL